MHLFISWHPDPNIFSTGFFSMQWYGLTWGLGILAAYGMGLWVFNKLKCPQDNLVLIIQYVFIGGLIGARLGQVFFYEWDYFAANPAEIIKVWKGGLASHGGMIGSLVGLWLFSRAHKQYSLLWLMDYAAICVPFLCSFIRFGNLMNSELPGKPTTLPWGFQFGSDIVARHPVVLYESLAYLLIQFLLIYLFAKYRDTKPGLYTVTFLLLMFGVRLALEVFKEPEADVIPGILSSTQALSLPFIALGLVLLYLHSKNKLHYQTPHHA